jgi:Cu(I)/Ag(I) efflux system membrane fusion protein
MKRNWRNSLMIPVALLILLALGACNKGKENAEHADTYTCPMHPTVVSDRPSTCPVCGMDLVRKARPGEEVKMTEELARLIKSPNESIIASIKTIKGEFKSMPVPLEAQGVVTYDTRRISTIPARIGGRLEKVFLKYSFQQIRKGQKVAEIYSPELITAQRELLYLIENDSHNSALIESAKSKLQLLGATQTQIDAVISSKEATSTFSIYSSYDGYVIREDRQAPAITTTSTASATNPGMDGMGAPSGASPTRKSTAMNASSSELVREGNYVSTGQTLFTVVNPSALRIELDLPVAQAGRVAINDDVELDLGNQMTVQTKVDFVQPFFTEGEEFVKVRLYVKNAGELKIGQLVSATIQLKAVESLWVPREALLDLGIEQILFVKERGVFKPINVKAGIRTAGWVQIIQGLSSSDEIASNAQYLVDSESFIKTN